MSQQLISHYTGEFMDYLDSIYKTDSLSQLLDSTLKRGDDLLMLRAIYIHYQVNSSRYKFCNYDKILAKNHKSIKDSLIVTYKNLDFEGRSKLKKLYEFHNTFATTTRWLSFSEVAKLMLDNDIAADLIQCSSPSSSSLQI
jgi:hypothetical protein